MVTTQEPKQIGFADLLLGLVALLSNELRARAPDTAVCFGEAWLFRSLVELGQRSTYAEDLHSLDDASFDAMWSQLVTWSLVEVEHSGRSYIMGKPQSERQLAILGRQGGADFMAKLRRMTADLLELLPT